MSQGREDGKCCEGAGISHKVTNRRVSQRGHLRTGVQEQRIRHRAERGGRGTSKAPRECRRLQDQLGAERPGSWRRWSGEDS